MYPPRTNSNRYFCAWAVQFLRICILPFLLQSLMGLSEGLTFLLRLFSELSLVLLAVLEEPSLQAWNLWDHDGSFPGIFLLRRCGHALLELDTPSLDPIQLLDKSKNAISRWSMNEARSSLLRSKQYRRFCVTRPIVEQKQWILQIAGVSVARRNTYHWSRPRLQLSVPTPGIQLCESVPSGGGRGAINTPGWICECVHSRFTVVCECDSQCVRRPQCWSDPEPT